MLSGKYQAFCAFDNLFLMFLNFKQGCLTLAIFKVFMDLKTFSYDFKKSYYGSRFFVIFTFF